MGLPDDVLGSAIRWEFWQTIDGGSGCIAWRAVLSSLCGLLGGTAAAQTLQHGIADPARRTQSAAGQTFGRSQRLVAHLSAKRASDVINLWIEPGQNRPITPEQLYQALGPEAANNLSRLTGLPQDQLLSELSRVLPGVVDKLTPQGRVPDPAEMSRW